MVENRRRCPEKGAFGQVGEMTKADNRRVSSHFFRIVFMPDAHTASAQRSAEKAKKRRNNAFCHGNRIPYKAFFVKWHGTGTKFAARASTAIDRKNVRKGNLRRCFFRRKNVAQMKNLQFSPHFIFAKNFPFFKLLRSFFAVLFMRNISFLDFCFLLLKFNSLSGNLLPSIDVWLFLPFFANFVW